MEEKLRIQPSYWLPAILFATLPMLQLFQYIMLQLSFPSTGTFNFSGYLSILWAVAYILLALALIIGPRGNLFICAFTLPVAISLVSLILNYFFIFSLPDLIIYGLLSYLVFWSNEYLPGCKKPAHWLYQIPGILGLIRRICSLPGTLTGIIFSIIYVLALLFTGIRAWERSTQEIAEPPAPITRLPGIGLFLFGILFLLSKSVNVILHYHEMMELTETLGISTSYEGLYGTSTTEFLFCTMVSICSIYFGIRLYYKKQAEIN